VSTHRTETVPQTWDDGTDPVFFTITARLFSAPFAYGAGVLLASYDPSPEPDLPAAGPVPPARTAAAPRGELLPVDVPRRC
jgi:hypothetical protein